ncbi:NAD-dependent epimerase/dehydratase family protein [Candidatus Roizmanbacteria bacterium]|nr:NAD-dependent epimerase/dehydratase family protein [Candidatus Roizmanbacteria bacterium]
MSKILITGGAGFIGSHIQDKLISLGHTVGIVDNLRSGSRENIHPSARFFEVDITDTDNLSETFVTFQPEIVYHLAAQNTVPDSMKDPQLDLNINIQGTFNVLSATHKYGAKKIIYTNTGGALYGDVTDTQFPIKESELIDKPTSFYGVSKLAAEYYLKLFGNVFGISWVSLRLANVYGPRQKGKGEAGIIAIFTEKMVKGEKTTINGNGSHTRDYVFISDVVEAAIRALQYNKSDYFHVSSGIEVSNQQIYDIMSTYLDIHKTAQYGPERPGDVLRNSLSNEKIRSLWNWTPTITIEEGIHKTIDYYRSHRKY